VVRRRLSRVAGAALAAVAVVGGVVAVTGPDGAAPSVPAASDGLPAEADVALPDGWRWESYGGVQVGVPGGWPATNGSQIIGQWCIGPQDGGDGFVGRPGASSAAGCFGKPGPTLEVVGPYVNFEGPLDGGDRPVRVDGDVARQVIGGVAVSVQAPQHLRERILATVHTVEVDANGCATADPISLDPLGPPEPGADVTTLTGVTSVTACRYPLRSELTEGPRLLSSEQLRGEAAQDVVAAIAAGEPGGGPNRPSTCIPDGSWGDEGLVLHIAHESGTARVHVRYQGCDHNGFDDGTGVYALTADAIRPLLRDSNSITTGLSAAADVVWGD
jgi:hypothetical protein